jgi:hypothetical protein
LRHYSSEPRKLNLHWLRPEPHLNRRSRPGVYRYSNELKKRSKNGKKRPGTLMVTTTTRTTTVQSLL